VSPEDAARYFLRIARELSGRNADDAMSAAVFADAGDISPELARLVRDSDARLETRKQALFWFGQMDAPTKDLIRLYDNLDARSLREHFTFVVSQRRDNEAIDKLIDIARGDRDSEVRKQAMFWLGQTKDPRAIKFFHDVLVP
jgi:HEAT repeat protein